MVRASKDIPVAGASVDRRVGTQDPRVVAVAAAGFLPFLGCFFVAVLWLVFAQPDMPLALAGFAAAFASVGGAIGWVAFTLTRAKTRASKSNRGGLDGASHKES
jgi:apolipoprotein N-acyltransferase